MAMMTRSRGPALSLQICMICALLFIESSTAVRARLGSGVADISELGHHHHNHHHGGGRGLLQSGTVSSCPYDFSKVDFSNVTSVCTAPSYDTSSCCSSFNKIACQYQPQINDFNSLCPIYFMSFLNMAGDYPAGVFIGAGRCNSGNNLCSSS